MINQEIELNDYLSLIYFFFSVIHFPLINKKKNIMK
jgi:hypothetical protein